MIFFVYTVLVQSMKYLPFILILILQCVVVRTDTYSSCLPGHNLLGKYDPAAGESRVGHALIDSKTFHLDTAGGFTGVLKVKKSQLLHEHFFQAIRTTGNYHFYFGQYSSDANFRIEMRDKNNVWCNSGPVGTLVLNQVHEIVFQLVSTTNSVRVVIDGTAYETTCPANFLWEDLETLGACFGGRWNSGTSPFTCQSSAYGSTLGAYYYDGVLTMDQTRQILDSILVDAPDSCAACEANAYKSTTILDLHKMCGADGNQNCAASAGSGEGFYTGSSAALLDGVLSGDAHRWHSAKSFGEADSLTIDLGRITNIDSVRVYPVSTAYRSRCKIYVSQEPQGHVITEANAGDLCADLSSLDFFQSVAWETATCLKSGRYVNLIFPANKGDWHEVAEVEVKGMCLSCPAGRTSPVGSTSIDSCELSCAANSYRDGLLQIDFYTGFSGRTWANAKAHAESLHGRLPTNQEMIDYAQFHGGFALHGWIATVSPTASGGKDFIYVDNGGGHAIGASHVEMYDGYHGYPSWGDDTGTDHGWFTHYAVATDLSTPDQDLAFCRSCGAGTVSYEGSHKTCTRETQIKYVHPEDSMMTFEEAKTYAANQGARLATVSEAKTYLSQNTVTINPDVCSGADTCEQWAWAITDNKNTGQAVLISEPGHPEFTEYYIGASTSDVQNSLSATSYPISQNTWLRPSWMRDTLYAIDILSNYEASAQIFWFGSYVIITYHPDCDNMCFDSSITPVKVTFSLTFGGSVTAAHLNEGRKQSIKIRIAKKLKVATGAVDIKTVRDARRRLLAVTMDVEISAETDEQAAEFSAMEADIVSATEEAVVDSGLDTTVSILSSCEEGVSISYWAIRKSICP